MFSGLRSVSKVFQTSALVVPRRGFFKQFLYPSERQTRVHQLHEQGILPGSPAFDKFYAELPQSELSKQSGLSDALLDDPLLHISVIKYNKHIVERYNLTPEEETKLMEEYEISCGEPSLEFCLPCPVPAHNFEELPIMKAYTEGEETKH
ncbi:hypothetical protein CYY_002633 [Polysphondylium violaceum]|uniref:Cytochrome c oxidase subunit IV n=1 Tax=Polysphondylium violaceum TaxID=133409 RepID=A0A8J4PZV1_9MYCE|nr:hypothetical protein CYY_002633 [Polysphondylium violaceum]